MSPPSRAIIRVRKQPEVFAEVQCWNKDIVIVRCPFCDAAHEHDFRANFWPRACDPSCVLADSLATMPQYQLSFPFSTKSVGYELDQLNEFCVAAGTVVPAKYSDSEATSDILIEQIDQLALQDAPSSLKKWSEGRERIRPRRTGGDGTLPDSQDGVEETWTSVLKIDVVVERMAEGDFEYVQQYLSAGSPDRSLFLNGVNSEGISALSIAACKGHSRIVELLLIHKADPNLSDSEGKTPLMKAALWGHLETVQVLLRHHVKTGILDVYGRRAVDYAKVSEENDTERARNSNSSDVVTHEEILCANFRRKIIRALLLRKIIKGVVPTGFDTPAPTEKISTCGDPGVLPILARNAYLPEVKTFARLDRGPGYPVIEAKSGWERKAEGSTLPGEYWTQKAVDIADYIDFDLLFHLRGGSEVSKHGSACHVEKQLVAYFLDKHVLWHRDSPFPKTILPGLRLSGATISTSKDPCENCESFIATINEKYHLKIVALGPGSLEVAE